MGYAPPVMRLALAFAAGVAWVQAGAPWGLAPLVAVALLALPNRASSRPGSRGLWLAAALAGLGAGRLATAPRSCSVPREGEPAALVGRFLASPRGGSAPFLPETGCGVVTVVTSDSSAPAGRTLRLLGSWREGRNRPWLLATDVATYRGGTGDAWRWAVVRWRDSLVARLGRLYGPRAPLVSALTLARTEGLDSDLRETFARAGIAHLLAISGFHVGVIAGIALAMLRLFGLERRRAAMGSSVAAWVYVALIGFPEAACRAALILALVSLSWVRARPPARWGALAAAFLILVAADPSRLAKVGFQLSFAGAAGLVAWSGGLGRAIRRASRGRCPRALATGLAAGVAATAATLPAVAWHFERVSLIGIPATLAAAPLVALALVGALGSLALDFVSHGLARFLAGGVTAVVQCLEWGAASASSWSWASVWVTKRTVVAAALGVVAAGHLARRPRVRGGTRRMLIALYVLAAVLAWPMLIAWQGRGTAELLVIDVGQGDAIALRSPRGRWLLVDTGPALDGADPGAYPAVRALKARGVRRLEALVLTHPDLDHIGGAAAVLESLPVSLVLDPALPAAKRPFVEVLEEAEAHHVPWRAARAGERLSFDGLEVEVVHPTGEPDPRAETNAASVVLHVSYGDFDALLTGDAYKDVDREVAPKIGTDLEVLKVGHHGSDTSTDSVLLARTHPELALISVGRHNRYGHPSPQVIRRLERSGADIHRTDREGTISVLGRRDGTYSVRSERALRPR